MNVEEQLRRAINAHTANVDVSPGDYDAVEAAAATARTRHAARVRRYIAGGIAAAAAVSIAVVASVAALRDDDSPTKVEVADPGTSTSAPQSTSTGPTATTVPSTTAPVVVPPATVPPPTTIATAPPAPIGLWPFRSNYEADVWWAPNGPYREPWHMDAGETALRFTRDYLGYTDIDTVANVTLDGYGARVTVGIKATPEVTTTAAVIRLVRVGSTPNGPWEVIGTEDSDFRINPIASPASSPLTVTGSITGVDENVKVQVLSPSAGRIGEACCAPAGEPSMPWTLQVDLIGDNGDLLTVAASTGGHLAGVERFTVTSVRTS
jgi:hypothetical protein